MYKIFVFMFFCLFCWSAGATFAQQQQIGFSNEPAIAQQQKKSDAQQPASAQQQKKSDAQQPAIAQQQQPTASQPKSELQQKAESADEKGNVAGARFHFIRAYEDYARRGQIRQGVECGIRGAALYYRENYYKEAFDLLRSIDHSIDSASNGKEAAALHFQTARERMKIYMKLKKNASAQEMLAQMEQMAQAAQDDAVNSDLLYNKAVFYYTFGQTAQGNAIFKQMASKLTAAKEYDKVDEVYKTLIASGQKSGSAALVAQAYSGYVAWKDSVYAQKKADELAALQQQIEDGQASIAQKERSLATRQGIIVSLCVLAAALAAALVLGFLWILQLIYRNRRLKKSVRLANENNALKAQFISNISAQLKPTLEKLDTDRPEVRALQAFAGHIQELSHLESTIDERVPMTEVKLQPFCQEIMEQIRDKVRADVQLKVDAPAMSASINQEYVTRILSHLLGNAAKYTPEGGHIRLDYRKRSATKHQFLVSNTGSTIPAEKREDVFKPFLEIRDLTEGDGLGLPICKLMAAKMNGELDIDPEFTKGIRFALTLLT